MIYMILILFALVLGVLEYYWANSSIKAMDIRSDADHILAEPGEVVTWSAAVENHSRIPIPFVRLVASFSADIRLHSEPIRTSPHSSTSFTNHPVEVRMALRPRRSATRQVKLSFSRRGQYTYGNCQVSAGDLLGFKETFKHGTPQSIVIMPERSAQQVSIDALGSFLGDICVRRFILEDPILTLGFRDYTGREPMKSISWTRSATAGSLQVKQFDHTAERHIVVLLNVEGATGAEFEECLRLVRTVCEKLEQKKIPYGFRTNGSINGPVGKIFHMAEGLGSRHLRTLLFGLGRADKTCFHSFHYLAERTLKHRSSNESYIIITPALKGSARAAVRKLENAVGNNLCILTARVEKKEVTQ